MMRLAVAFILLLTSSALLAAQDVLPGTKPLELKGDIASDLVAGVDKFLLKKIDNSVEKRARFWNYDFASADAFNKSIEPNRKRLAHILGVRDPRVAFDAPELLATTTQSALVGKGANYQVFAVRWPAFADIHGEGLLLVPNGKPAADVVAIPDADQTPEQLAGLVEGLPKEAQFARRLAESGCRVVVPALISRARESRRGANLTHREYLYRSAFELGRHLIGYEVQKVLAVVDWFARDKGRIGVIGYGEGGMISLYAGALDPRIDAVGVSGYFGNRNAVWEQPIDRNVFGLLEQFGDAELAVMVMPRHLQIEAAKYPELTLPGERGAPARLVKPTEAEVLAEFNRADKLRDRRFFGTLALNTMSPAVCDASVTLNPFLNRLGAKVATEGPAPRHLREKFDPSVRLKRQIHELDRHNQALLKESPHVRKEFMKKWVDMTQASGQKLIPVEQYQKTAEEYRQFFAEEVIGKFDDKPLPFNARTRKTYDNPKWTGYEVVLDVFPDVIAYGILLLPKDLKPGEKRPVVVCQHGLEGRPQDVIGEKGFQYYKGFAGALAERGFITFAPQNLYIFTDRFRTLQRKANPLKKTLFSVIVPQHQQIVDWLKTHPNVDGKRIAFYGLSYGGKSAMRIPPLVTDYCLSICSADFNEWVKKNASTRERYSYVWTGEYEIFEFDLGSTFNYAEMAALIAPRPFMVERGHFDGVGEDEEVAYEFAKVRFIYQARLGLKDRCAIEWFVGPHTINGQGTYDFLHKHLDWPKR